MATDDYHVCSGYIGGEYTCNDVNPYEIPALIGAVSGIGLAGLGIYMLLD